MREMTETRFRELADAFGSDLAKWPSSERDAARALLSERRDLEAVLAEWAELDAALTDILDEAELQPRPVAELGGAFDLRGFLSALWPFGGLWQPAAGLVAASAAGFIVGISLTDLPAETTNVYDDQLTIVESALGAETLEINQ
ncbi:MAG: hypothetical protein JJ959_20820 [Nisaea sp.]|uniref:hypothetical protein n=1 Tax=Nisaea sp. TaxID=2024842 RepID=UPI001B0793D8|nr:hypothetical protein [Nisaea sp.]MBO6563000.1 hypothetical protein [Nisaea sp.]